MLLVSTEKNIFLEAFQTCVVHCSIFECRVSILYDQLFDYISYANYTNFDLLVTF